MVYLLDSNTLIQAKNEYYAFDLCPGFWDWIAREHAAGNVFSIERVRRELEVGNDDLSQWAMACPAGFFLADDAPSLQAMATVSNWVQNENFRPEAKRSFLAGADPFLIAQALAHGHTVVTHEVHIEGERRKVKIPTVCRALNVPYERTFQVLRNLQAAFVLQGAGP